ncbi:MAG: hypothetical protein ACOC22_03970 [bacterium]
MVSTIKVIRLETKMGKPTITQTTTEAEYPVYPDNTKSFKYALNSSRDNPLVKKEGELYYPEGEKDDDNPENVYCNTTIPDLNDYL